MDNIRKYMAFICLLFSFLSLYFVACAEVSVGKEAPEISAENWLYGNGLKLADSKDKIVVVEFWATWCPPCRESIKHLKKMNAEYKTKNVVFVSLTNEDKATVEKFNHKAKPESKMDWLVGTGSNTANQYGVRGIPQAFIVQNGIITWSGHPMDGLDKRLAELTR